MTDQPDLLTLRDIAKITGLAEGSVRAYHNAAARARREGKVQPTDLPAPDLTITRSPTWRRETIDAWLAAREERRRVAAERGEPWAGTP
jgi:predicted DNA-binding transcriptional regulator AlpA